MVHPKPSLAHQSRFLLPRRVSREGWRGKFTFSCSRISARAVSLGQWGRQFRQENLPRPCFPLHFSWGQRRKKKRVASTRTNSVHFETGILRPIGKQGQGCLKILNNLIWNICSRSLSQVFRRNLRLIVLS